MLDHSAKEMVRVAYMTACVYVCPLGTIATKDSATTAAALFRKLSEPGRVSC